MSGDRCVIIGAILLAIGLTANDWLPTGLLTDIGSLGNHDRRSALRGLSIVLLLLGCATIYWRNWIARNLGGLLVMLASGVVCIVVFVSVDIAITKRLITANRAERSVSNVNMSDDLLGWRPKPGAIGKHHEGVDFDVEYAIDADGFKATPNVGVAQSRIFIFGDSYTFGHGVTNADTFANIIASEYLKGSVHVFNVGVMGYGIEQMYGRLLELESQLTPRDLVVFAPTSQDIKRNMKDFLFPSKLIFGERVEFGHRYPYYQQGALKSVALNTRANRLAAMLFNGRWTGKGFRFLHSAMMSPATTSEALEMINHVSTVVRARGAKFALFFLPQTKECWRGKYEEDLSQFEYFDIMDYFPHDRAALSSLRFKHDSHWNRSGHEIAARAIVQTLIERGVLAADYLQPRR